MTSGEACDDGGTAAGDGCNEVCQIEAGWTCSGTPSVCLATAVPALSRESIGLLVIGLLSVAWWAYRRLGPQAV